MAMLFALSEEYVVVPKSGCGSLENRLCTHPAACPPVHQVPLSSKEPQTLEGSCPTPPFFYPPFPNCTAFKPIKHLNTNLSDSRHFEEPTEIPV